MNYKAKSLAIVTTILSILPAYSAENVDDFTSTRRAVMRAAIDGCVAAIVDPAVQAYMRRAAEAGKPFSHEQAARLEMTGTREWRTIIAPAIPKGCECAMADELSLIAQAQSLAEINQINASLLDVTRERNLSDARMRKFENCFQPIFDAIKKPSQ